VGHEEPGGSPHGMLGSVRMPFPEPTLPVSSRAEVFAGYLDYFRSRVLTKVQELPPSARRRSQLPSGWTPLQLLKHLTFVELRWLVWGFEGRTVADPWGDLQGDRWHTGPDETFEHLAAALRAQGEMSREIIVTNDLSDAGQPGPRWEGADPPTLERILFHLVQEYARHLGQLDIVVEVIDGSVGE
jgi:uncharacterized damage-inducible protein DinB